MIDSRAGGHRRLRLLRWLLARGTRVHFFITIVGLEECASISYNILLYIFDGVPSWRCRRSTRPRQNYGRHFIGFTYLTKFFVPFSLKWMLAE